MIRKAMILVSMLGIAAIGLAFTLPAQAGEKGTEAVKEEAPAAPSAVNLNTASAEELAQLEGLDEVKAAAIVEYRSQNGPFQKVEDVMLVQGVTGEILAVIVDKVTVE